MQKRRLFSFFCLVLFLCTLNATNISANGRKRKLTNAASVTLGEPQPSVCDTQLRLFTKACINAGIKIRRCILDAGEKCLNPETDSIASEDIETTPETESIISDTESPPSDLESVIELAHQQVSNLIAGGQNSLAAEHIENTLFQLSAQAMKIADLNHRVLLRFLELFRVWSQLPHMRKDSDDANYKIKQWLSQWADTAWLEYASDLLIDLLSHTYEFDKSEHEDLPTYHDLILDDALQNITPCVARDTVKFMVKAAVVDGERQEHLLREAVLTGYSHPLPYLRLIDHLVSRGLYQQADHVFEMYRLAVLFNRSWYIETTDFPRDGDEYWHRQELYRLQGIYQKSLDRMKKQVSTREDDFFPDKQWLNESLKNWPENTRNRAEDMLFAKAFEVSWNMRKPLIDFAEAVIERSMQRWHNEGLLPSMAGKVESYINDAYAPRTLETLHDKLATMLTRLGREREASDRLYKFVDGYKKGLGTDYDLALYLIAVAHSLSHRGQDVKIPSYGQALELGQKISASGQQKALGERLVRIRKEAQNEQADLAELSRLFSSIPSELIEFNPKGSMESFFSYNLRRGLQEAVAKGCYEEENIPSLSGAADFNRQLSDENDRMLQLFRRAFDYADIEEITGLYLEGINKINKQPISRESLALQWMSISRWLAEHDKSIHPINTLNEALALIPDSESGKNYMFGILSSMRDGRWISHSQEMAKKVSTRYKRGMFRILSSMHDNSSHSSEMAEKAPANKGYIKKRLRKKKKATLGKSKRLRPETAFHSTGSGYYILHQTPIDGLCMYHALSAAYRVDGVQLIQKMMEYLKVILIRINQNILNKQPLFAGLTDTQIQAITPIVTTGFSGDGIQLAELELQIESLSAALFQAVTGVNQAGQAWGSASLLNTAAVVLNGHFGLNGSIFALFDGWAGPVIHEFHSNGQQSSHGNVAISGQPMLVHNGFDHWLFATHLEELSSLSDQFNQLYISGYDKPYYDSLMKSVQHKMSKLLITTAAKKEPVYHSHSGGSDTDRNCSDRLRVEIPVSSLPAFVFMGGGFSQ